ncbi:MAG: tetratricopeptide repeat protein [Candidatus Thiosymbion ectosymbiont of Robbea hypermnestra]|nr:tetratricopeptide repeat protein [Candidatus Thiosymbion ectosymbiont of Robbea hypermnestra]
MRNKIGKVALSCVMAFLAVVFGVAHGAPEFGASASEETLAAAVALATKRSPVLEKARELADADQANEALDALESYLTEHPGDIIAANLYRRLAVAANLYDRPIRFFVGQVKQLTPCPQEPPVCPEHDKDCAKKIMARCSPDAKPPGPPAGLRYNLAFGYIDKIPVVGPMGAGFLSKRSIEQFRLALEKDPDDWIANYGVGMNYLHWPDYFEKNDTSITYFERAIVLQEARAIRPSDILAYVRLGDAFAKAGNLEQARDAWQRGLVRLGSHGDLVERLEIAPARLKEAVIEAYNPNNSIGAIDTDISILWARETPERVFSLRNPDRPVVVGGVGGQTLPERSDYEDARLFNWFRDNLPLLLHRENADQVDMSGIGATGGEGAGVIAYNMIKGFMTQFRGEDAATVVTALTEAPDYDRPFFHEGIGMGLAASLDTSADGSLAPFPRQLSAFDQRFDRLHYAGLGMWYGLAPTVNLVRVRNKFSELDLRGQFYAYEGMGFAVALFKEGAASRATELVTRLPFALGSTFAHGAGRALWIKHGDDTARVRRVVSAFPEQFQGDARAGFGMGVAFTRIDRLDVILSQIPAFSRESPMACLDYLTGAAMGLAIRYKTDPGYVRDAMKRGENPRGRVLVPTLLQAGLDGLAAVEQVGTEMHRNWRTAIRGQLSDGPGAATPKEICEETTQ